LREDVAAEVVTHCGRGDASSPHRGTLMTTNDANRQDTEAFGQYLRMQRKLADLSLRELAAMTDLSNAYISQLERGLHQPSMRVMRAISRALNVSVEELFGEQATADRTGADAGATDVEKAIRADDRLSPEQKDALLTVYRSYITEA
jgi:transcriptional regulator with XRE-family HTH domain